MWCTFKEEITKRMTQSRSLQLQSIEHLQQRRINRDGRTKESSFRFPRVANCGKVNIWEETN